MILEEMKHCSGDQNSGFVIIYIVQKTSMMYY